MSKYQITEFIYNISWNVSSVELQDAVTVS